MGNFRTIMTDAGNCVRLETVIFEPRERTPFCTVIFSTGICMDCRDLRVILEPLSDLVRVVSYNYRGHGLSDGIFDPSKAVGDLEYIAGLQSGPTFLMGYSTGCSVGASAQIRTRGHILMSPYLDRYYLSRVRRLALKSARYLSGPLSIVDSLLSAAGIARCLGFKNKRALVDVTEIDKMRSPQQSFKNTPALWMVPDRDEMLGTWMNPEHLEDIRSRLRRIYPTGIDMSDLVSGLNHLLNTQVGNLFTAFSCPDKTRNMIVENILNFCRDHI